MCSARARNLGHYFRILPTMCLKQIYCPIHSLLLCEVNFIGIGHFLGVLHFPSPSCNLEAEYTSGVEY